MEYFSHLYHHYLPYLKLCLLFSPFMLLIMAGALIASPTSAATDRQRRHQDDLDRRRRALDLQDRHFDEMLKQEHPIEVMAAYAQCRYPRKNSRR